MLRFFLEAPGTHISSLARQSRFGISISFFTDVGTQARVDCSA